MTPSQKNRNTVFHVDFFALLSQSVQHLVSDLGEIVDRFHGKFQDTALFGDFVAEPIEHALVVGLGEGHVKCHEGVATKEEEEKKDA
jgi:hypothetical protein